MMESVILYSGRTLSTMRHEGGLGHWPGRAERIKACEYLVAVRNIREQFADRSVLHGTAFMIAKLEDVVPSDLAKHRLVIKFSQYINVGVPDAWRKLTSSQRYPVAIIDTKDMEDILGVDLANAQWLNLLEPTLPTLSVPDMPRMTVPHMPTQEASSLVEAVDATKKEVASMLGIPISAIEIKITV